MPKHVMIMFDDGHMELRGEILFDPQEGVLHIMGEESQATFNWSKIQFFVVNPCEECEA